MNKDLDFTLEVLRYYGKEPEKVDKYTRCVFHNDNRPSARLFDSGSYHCWAAGCQVHFNNAYEVIMHEEQCSFSQAVKIAVDRFGATPKKSSKKVNRDILDSIEDSIVKLVIKNKPKSFLSIYKTLDELLDKKDMDKLKKLHLKLLQGEIK